MTPADLMLILAAPAVGSFLGTLVLRLPENRPVLFGRSACEACGTPLGARELVPVLSWLVQRGRCRHCGGRVSACYPAVELAALVVAIWAATETGGAALLFSCLLGWGLLALALLDARHFWLPDVLTLPLLAIGLAAAAWLDPAAWQWHAAGAAVGYGVFTAIAWLYRRIRGSDGLGGGDAKLLAVAGAWLGLPALPPVVLGAAVGGLALAAATRSRRVALGVPLAATIWALWLYGVPMPG